jgi:hypothetical protein
LDTSYEKCTSFEDPIKMSIGVEGEGYSVLISEYSIKKIDVDARIGHQKSNGFSVLGLVNTSYSYGLGGFTGLSFLARYSYEGQHFTFKFGAGVQAAISYGQYQEKALFAFTPLVEASIGVLVKKINASIYLDFADPYEREWKALPTIGLKAVVSATKCISISANLFVKFAEYLVDPVTLVMAYGFRLGCVVDYEGLGL